MLLFAALAIAGDCADLGSNIGPRLAVVLVNTDVCRSITLANAGPAMVPADHGYSLEGASLDLNVSSTVVVCTAAKEVRLSHCGQTLQRFGISEGITVVDGNHTVVYAVASGPTNTTVAAVFAFALLAAWLFNACMSRPY